MADHLAFRLESPESFVTALAALAEFERGSVGFADCLILAQARATGAPLLTFDEKLGRLQGAREVD